MKFFRILPLFLLALVPATLFAQTDFRRLEPAEAAAVLEEFRAFRMSGDACMKFTITHLLRKSDEEKHFAGTLFVTWENSAPVLRIEIRSLADSAAPAKKFLLRGGNAPELWKLDDKNRPVRLDELSTRPFFENLIFTPFDLQTPFVYWSDAEYERTKRFRGRPVHFFKMTPPESFRAAHPEVSFVRIGFDRVYNALVSAEVFGADGKLQKTFSLSGVQKVQEQYTIRELELRDDATRDKDEFVVRAAAMNLKLPRAAFTPEGLAEPAPAVPASRFSRL